jgi:HSP20 family molecular chaperone IbpA
MLTLWNPFVPVAKSERALNRKSMFDSLFDETFDGFFRSTGLDYKKTDDGSLVMTVDLPGVKEENINIEVSTDNILTVKGERKTATSTSSVQKSLTIPEDFDPDSVKAELADGVLTLTLFAKVPKQQEAKKIKINQK